MLHCKLMHRVKSCFTNSAFLETKRSQYSCLALALRPRALSWFTYQREKVSVRRVGAHRHKNTVYQRKMNIAKCRKMCQNVAILTSGVRSSKSGVDADFESVEVDVTWRQTDRTNGVGEGDCRRQLEQSNVAKESIVVIVRVRDHSGHTGVEDVRLRISRKNSSESHLQLRSSKRLISTIHNIS